MLVVSTVLLAVWFLLRWTVISPPVAATPLFQ
jgi:hypothetical protein